MKPALFIKQTILICFFSLFIHVIRGQFNYTFTATTGTYSPNTSPTVLFCCGDDNVFAGPITLGLTPNFVFKFGCTNYTEVVITDNGMFTFDPTCSTFHNVNNLNSQAIDRPIVAPLWDDLGCDFAGGSVNYKLTGSSPTRVFTIEWKQMLWGWMAGTWGISFQAKLYEGTNVIEFIYQRNGTATANLNSPTASIGLGGPAVGSYYSLNGVGASPLALTSPETNNLNSKPATGQIYRWTPVCALPISLVDFSGTNYNGRNVLSWTTSSEENNAYFTLERSGDGINFTEIAKVEGANNSNVMLKYSAVDPEPSLEIVYYRLKQTDHDDQFTYSEMITVATHGSNEWIVYPNPAHDHVTIEGGENIHHYRLFNTSGILVTGGAAVKYLSIDLSMIPRGMYFLEVNQEFKKLLLE
jgi:hypothetical protein